jgi:hypothetical protein
MRKGCITLAACLLLTGCGSGEKLPLQAPADLVKITTLAGTPKLARKEIREKEKVAALVAYVNSLPDRWNIPWYGAPVGRVYFEFISGGKSTGNFFVGPNFVGRESGKAYSQGAGKSRIQEVGKIVGIDLWGYMTSAVPPPISVAATVTPTPPPPTRHP